MDNDELLPHERATMERDIRWMIERLIDTEDAAEFEVLMPRCAHLEEPSDLECEWCLAYRDCPVKRTGG